MLGAILGDIVGSPYEFNNTKDYHFELFTPMSNVTDDSILTAAIAQWLLSDPTHSRRKLEECLVNFTLEFPNPVGDYGSSFKNWVFCPAFKFTYVGDHLVAADSTIQGGGERRPYHSWGNGSAMRVSSVGWMFDSLEMTEEVAKLSASITHNHLEGIKGAQAVAAAIFLARTGNDKESIKVYIERTYGYQLTYDREVLHATYEWDSSCQGTVPQAIWAFLESTDFEDALRIAVSLGGDSDTLACITGSIAEAFYKEIPELFVKKAISLMPKHLIDVLKQMKNTFYQPYYESYIQNSLGC